MHGLVRYSAALLLVLAGATNAFAQTTGNAPPAPRPAGALRVHVVPPFPAKPTKADLDDCLAVADAFDADLGKQLRELRETKPAEFERRVRGMRRLWELANLKRRDPSAYELKLYELRVDANVRRLVREIQHLKRTTKGSAQIDALRTTLEGEVRLQIAFDHLAREEYLCRVQDHATALLGELKRIKDTPGVMDERIELHLTALIEGKPTSGSPLGLGNAAIHDTRLSSKAVIPEVITEADVTELLGIARDLEPALADKLVSLRKTRPEAVVSRLRTTPQLWTLLALKRKDPNLYSLRCLEHGVTRDVRRLTKEVRVAKAEGDTAAIKAKTSALRNQLRLQFVFSFQTQEDHLTQLQALATRLEQELKAETARFEADFDGAVARRVDALLMMPKVIPVEDGDG